MPDTDSALRAWETRRQNQFLADVKRAARQTPRTDELLLISSRISEFLIQRLPELVIDLPRGYAVTRNQMGERSLCRNGALLAPSYIDPLPGRDVVDAFVQDLQTGWLDELAETPSSFSTFWITYGRKRLNP